MDEKDEIVANILACPAAENHPSQDLIWSDPAECGGRRVREFFIEKEGKTFFLGRDALLAPKTLAQVLSAVLRPQRKSQRKLSRLQKKWSFFVGGDLAQQMQPLGLRNGILTVAVASEGLRYEMLSFHAASLLETIRTYFPDLGIRQIRFILQQGND